MNISRRLALMAAMMLALVATGVSGEHRRWQGASFLGATDAGLEHLRIKHVLVTTEHLE